ncbi:MAG TPA: hypothetical protein VIE46_08790 [Gemmatimonadales bacterium]
MTLAAFAILVGAPPKWCQNALSVLGRPLRYTEPLARTLGLARLLEQHGLSLKTAVDRATEALAVHPPAAVRWRDPSAITGLRVDVPRYVSQFSLRQARLRDDPPRGAGRPPASRKGGGIRAAARYGLDLDALKAGLRLSPAERLVALDANQRLVAALRAGRRAE